MTDTASVAPAAQPAKWARLLLLIAAMIEFLGGLGSLPILFGDLNEVPGPGLDGQIILAGIVLKPLLALAALFFTVRGKIPYALVAMAFIILMAWLSYVPSVRLHGLDLSQGDAFTTTMLGWELIVAPVLALAVAGLALRETQLTLATVLAVLPTLAHVLSVIAFGVSVAIYGF
ncbi:hypothetical protein GIW81_15945 [Hyphomicrobium sp. xq]|uniref:Uncharacterized protein n=1 Tax=Hyphomicrobium album TaxID=2665159 RepID=A0A6I3KPT7_9HYPH|nr:hypothetical protein [Hyphomicrobium album]MTD95832.1 hypothetical protein [Hyphomicrobium album]